MATYGGAVAYLLTLLKRSDTSITAAAEQEILNAIEFYAAQRFWFNEGAYTFTTSSSLATYAFPADIMEIDSVTYTLNGRRWPLEQENNAVLDQWDGGGEFGQPRIYSVWAENFRLYPVPNATYTVGVLYQKRLATLSVSTDTSAWTTHGLELITRRAGKQLLATRYEDNQGAMAWQQLEDQALGRLEHQTEKLIGTGRIESSD